MPLTDVGGVGRIDLHSHTTASDGELVPRALVELAARRGVATLAITDHDTVAGVADAQACGHERGVQVIAGIELTAHHNRREIHLLGYFVDGAGPLEAHITSLAGRRRERMRTILARLEVLGVEVSLGEVEAVAGHAPLGRPHLARVLVQRRLVSSVKEAFARYLADGLAGHVPHATLGPREAIALIHGAGGVAVIAHPMSSRVNPLELAELAGWGLDGVEVDHPDQPPSYRHSLLGHASRLDLVPTAGSDFHGPSSSPDRPPGCVSMRPDALAQLHARAGRPKS